MTEKEKLTIVVFSGDLDRALAAFILATTAASMGLSMICQRGVRPLNMIFGEWRKRVGKSGST